MTKKKKPTKNGLKTNARLKVKPQSFYSIADKKQSREVFKALDWAYEQADDTFYGYGKTYAILKRLRDLAAVSLGKPTTTDMEEEDY